MTPALSLRGQAVSQAQFIVCNLGQTNYTDVEHIDVDRGRYDCDCFALAGFVMERSAPAHYHMIPKTEEGQPRRHTAEYYKFFSSLSPEPAGGWRQIDLLRDARRGNVIAWQPPDIGKVPCHRSRPFRGQSARNWRSSDPRSRPRAGLNPAEHWPVLADRQVIVRLQPGRHHA